MNVKVPNGIKNPTVVIVSGGTMSGDEKSNKFQEKRMDLLEKKLNEQYKAKTEPNDYSKNFEQISKSFTKELKQLIGQNRQDMASQNSKLLEALKKTKKEIKSEPVSNNGEIKTFLKKIDSLEEAIRKLSIQKPTINVNRSVKLDGAFEQLFARLEKAIKEAKPKIYPSPS